MTQIEIYKRVRNMRDLGKKVLVIIPERGVFPKKFKWDKVKEEIQMGLDEKKLINKIEGYYASQISTLMDDEIDEMVRKIFNKAQITCAFGILFY